MSVVANLGFAEISGASSPRLSSHVRIALPRIAWVFPPSDPCFVRSLYPSSSALRSSLYFALNFSKALAPFLASAHLGACFSTSSSFARNFSYFFMRVFTYSRAPFSNIFWFSAAISASVLNPAAFRAAASYSSVLSDFAGLSSLKSRVFLSGFGGGASPQAGRAKNINNPVIDAASRIGSSKGFTREAGSPYHDPDPSRAPSNRAAGSRV